MQQQPRDYTVTELDLSNEGLTCLPEDILLYTNLRILNCNNNQLTSLDKLPNTLEELDC
jgi:Leucine-rich repeat (LRR) protein